MKIGLVGIGGYGQFLLEVIKEIKGFEIFAISSRDSKKLEKIAKKFEVLNTFTSWKELIKNKDIEAVVISTPPYLHFEMAKLALISGKHVLIEKPLTMNTNEANILIKLAQKKNLRLVVDHELRYSPIFIGLKKIVDLDLFGNLLNINFTNFASDEGLAPDHWFWDKKKSGGIFIEHSCHFFDSYGDIFGKSKIKYSTRQLRSNGVEDRVFALNQYENGAIGSYLHAFNMPSALEQTSSKITFERANVLIEGWVPLKLTAKAVLSQSELKHVKEIFPLAYFKIPGNSKNYLGGGKEYPDHMLIEFNLDLGNKDKNYRALVSKLFEDFIKCVNDKDFDHPTSAKNVISGLDLACQSAKIAKLI
ncbi:MAG: Gfo/Idh/MocA family oxidoreductase [Patescibacteria group bacterium]|jgi:predicted dehydrogenase